MGQRRFLRLDPIHYLLAIPIGAALVAHSLYFNFICDDAYIPFVYARNFARFGQLVFNLGDRVEGYTDFLWTVTLALFIKLRVRPEISSLVLGAAFGAATLVLTMAISRFVRGRTSAWDALPALLLAISAGYACWCSGGLETMMYTFFVVSGVAAYLTEHWLSCGTLFALAGLTRPEGLLVFAVVAAHWTLSSLFARRDWRALFAPWRAAAAFGAILVPFFAWRWWYYGWPLPNTFYVKVGQPPSRNYAHLVLNAGGYYIWQWLYQSGALFALPLVVCGIWRHRKAGSLFALIVVVYLGYVLSVGGDFMGLHRFVMPLFVLMALLASLGLSSALGQIRRGTVQIAATAVALLALVGTYAFMQAKLSREAEVPIADHGIDRPGYLKLYAHDRGLIGKALRKHLRPTDFSIVGGAGALPYYADMRAIDVFGLVSETIAHRVPPSNPRPGHQKWAPAPFLLQYRPQFLFHCYDLHRTPVPYRLCGEAGFFVDNGYEPVTMHIPGLKEGGEYFTFLKRKDRDWTEEMR